MIEPTAKLSARRLVSVPQASRGSVRPQLRPARNADLKRMHRIEGLHMECRSSGRRMFLIFWGDFKRKL